jgi:MoaA/NifB/PqqE/SkfB family radical SAM enzyme
MIKLNGLHLLLTYQCTFECEHCFVWGSPWQSGTMTVADIRTILSQAKEAGSVEWIYFEGGEPFLYYQTMLSGINQAFELGFKVGVVTNSYWATSDEDALLWLTPLAGKIDDLTISSDLFHFSEKVSRQSKCVTKAAEQLNIPLGIISIEQPEIEALSFVGQIPSAASSIMFRGRAAEKLAPKVPHYPAEQFTTCPHENLADPGRVHVDPYGDLHICQGISLGNLFASDLKTIWAEFDPINHPIISALLDGGPFRLAKDNNIPTEGKYADACHFCFETRKLLRSQYPDTLKPDQMYAVTG